MSASAQGGSALGLLAGLLAVVYAAACLFPGEPSSVHQEVAAAQLSAHSIALVRAADTVRLGAVGLDRNGYPVAGASFNWRSGSECVATVDAGLVTAWGGGATAITATPTNGGSSDAAAVSVTGAPALQIAFTSSRGIEALCAGQPGRTGTVLIAKGSADDVSQPAWSPDGTRLAFIRSCSVYTARADGSDLLELNIGDPVSMSQCYQSPTWSPDGTKIAFSRGNWNFFCRSDCSSTIYVENADGSNIVQLVPPASDVYYGNPTWSPDGTKLALHDGFGSILVVNADGSGGINVVNDSGAYPAWSPDGSQIAFVNETGIWVMNPDGSSATKLKSSGALLMGRPAWSPDGARLVFNGFDGVQWDLFAINRDGTGLQNLTSTPESEYHPDWRPTGPPPAPRRERGRDLARGSR